ncbi:unnamed protein product [Clavelina lepadiformis]|uniref:Uncharacterized protein n=1 Tax=Clavelina lepadiformis TaxID=159417 RepID=A0ABP0FZM3_CLALP
MVRPKSAELFISVVGRFVLGVRRHSFPLFGVRRPLPPPPPVGSVVELTDQLSTILRENLETPVIGQSGTGLMGVRFNGGRTGR